MGILWFTELRGRAKFSCMLALLHACVIDAMFQYRIPVLNLDLRTAVLGTYNILNLVPGTKLADEARSTVLNLAPYLLVVQSSTTQVHVPGYSYSCISCVRSRSTRVLNLNLVLLKVL